jgi:hypothetical protein
MRERLRTAYVERRVHSAARLKLQTATTVGMAYARVRGRRTLTQQQQKASVAQDRKPSESRVTNILKKRRVIWNRLVI